MTQPNDAKAWLAAIVRAVMGEALFLGQYPCRIVTQRDSGTLDVVPDDKRIPAMTEVPIRYGVPGVSVKVTGGRCLVSFENGDPRYPVATLWETATVREIRITTTTKVVLDCPDVNLGDESGAPIARVGDPIDIVFDAVAIAAAVAGGGILQAVGVISSGGSKVKAS